MKKSKDSAKNQQCQEHSGVGANVAEEFPVVDISIPKVSEVEVLENEYSSDNFDDDFTVDIRGQSVQADADVVTEPEFGQQKVIKKHINNLWQELTQLSSNTDSFGQKLEHFSKQQKLRNRWMVALVILIVMDVGVMVWFMENQTNKLIPQVESIVAEIEENNTERQYNVEKMQQNLVAMQSEQQLIKSINTGLQKNVLELNEQLGRLTLVTQDVSVDQPKQANLSTNSDKAISELKNLIAESEKNDAERQNNVENLQQKLVAMESEQQQIKTINTGLQNNVLELNEQLEQFQEQLPIDTQVAPVEQAQKLDMASPLNKVVSETSEWVVGLESFQKQLDARQKALEYIAKDVPVIISPSNVNGEAKYSIIVEGFKNKQNALVYAQKLKKRLNLEKTWIGRVK